MRGSAAYNPHGVGTGQHFFRLKTKKPKKIMAFEPQKGGGFDIFATPPAPNGVGRALMQCVQLFSHFCYVGSFGKLGDP